MKKRGEFWRARRYYDPVLGSKHLCVLLWHLYDINQRREIATYKLPLKPCNLSLEGQDILFHFALVLKTALQSQW